MGFDYVIVSNATHGVPREARHRMMRRFAEEVIPLVRTAAGAGRAGRRPGRQNSGAVIGEFSPSLRHKSKSRKGTTPCPKSDLYKKGEAVRRKLRGDADFEKNMKEYATDPHTAKFIELATETVFGALWATADARLQDAGADLRHHRRDHGPPRRARHSSAVRAERGLDRGRAGGGAAAYVRLCRRAADPRGIYCAKDVFADERKKARKKKG